MNEKIDWGDSFDIEKIEPFFYQKNSNENPLVTIGLPTYKRSETIKRTLESLAKQSFRNFVVIISDNAGSDEKTLDAVKIYSNELPEVYIIAQEDNLGAIPNYKFLLACAQTKYYMWLADDDEISPNYLENLVSILESDQNAVSAMGKWVMVDENGQADTKKQLDNSNDNKLYRILKYILGPTDDSFFYGLHRIDKIRNCRFEGYFFPNKNVLTNYCHIYLFDLLLQGPIKYSDQSQWICHGVTTAKNYKKAASKGCKAKLATFIRRINIHYLYSRKTAQKYPTYLFLTVIASFVGFSKEVTQFFLGKFIVKN